MLQVVALHWPTSALAQVYWDLNSTTAGSSGGTTAAGTWDQATTTAWSTSSAGTGATNNWAAQVSNGGGGTVANFAAGTNATGSYTVTVSGNVGDINSGYIAGIAIDEGTLTFGGTGALYIRASGVDNNTANLVTFGSGVAISLVSNQTWDTGTGGITAAGVVSGSANLTKAGSGTLTLSGTNTFTGVTTINAGTLSVATIGNGGVSGNLGAATNAAGNLVLGGGELEYTGTTASTNRNFTLTAATTSTIDVSTGGTNLTISGASTATTGALTKTGAGTLTLSGANLHTGTTTVSAGTLAYGANNALASGAVTVNGGILDIGTFTDTVGAVTLTSGTITGSTGVLTGTSYAMQSGTVSAILGGAVALTKTTAGTVTLSSANTYTGLTTVSAGTLAYGVNNALASGAVTVNGGTFDIGTFSDTVGAVTLTSGAITGSTGVLTGTSYAMQSGTVSAILGGAVALTKTTAGTVTLSGTNTYTGATTINAGTLSVATIGNGGVSGNLGAATNAAGNLVLGGGELEYTGTTASTNRNFTLTAATTSTIDVSTGGTNLTISGASTATTGALTKTGAGTLTLSGANLHTGTTTVSAGTLAYGANNALASGAVTVNGGILDIGTFTDTVGAVTLTSGTITGSTGVLTGTSYAVQDGTISAILGGTGGLTKTTAGTVTLSGTNTYTGVTTISGGILSVGTIGNGGVAGNLGQATNAAGNIVINGGTLQYTGATGSTNRGFTLGTSGGALDASGTGAITFSAGPTLSGTNTARTLTLTGNNTAANTLSGVIANNGSGATSVTKSGTGTWVLGGANTYTGITTLNSGTLSVGSIGNGGVAGNLGQATNAANRIVFNGGELEYTGATGSSNRRFTITGGSTGAIDVTSGAATLTIAGATGTATTGSFSKLGDGTLIFSGAQTYTGSTSIGAAGGPSGGTLQYSVANNLSSGAVNVYGGTLSTLTFSDTIGALNLGGGATGTSANVLLGNGSVLTLGGDVTYSATNDPLGATINKSGTTGALALGANRIFNVGDSANAATDLGVSAIVTGAFGINKQGDGTLALSGANTFTGVTTLTAGTLSVGSIGNGGVAGNLGQATNAANRIVFNGGTLQYTGATGSSNRAFTLNNATTGTIDVSSASATLTIAGATGAATTGALTKTGDGTLVLSGAQTNTGTTTVNAGILQVNASNRLSDSSNLVINAPGTFQFDWGSLTETVGSLSGDGTLSIRGSTFITNTAANTTFSGTITDSYGNFRKAGTGDLTLTGNSSYTGLTYIDGGTLIAASSGALGGSTSGNVIASGATLGLQGNITVSEGSFSLQGTGDGGVGAIHNISDTNTLTAALNFAGGTTIGATAGTLNLTNSLNLSSAVIFDGTGDFNASGQVYGSSSLTKNGTGTLTFSGSQSYSANGGVYLNNGTIVLDRTAGTSAIGQGIINIGDNIDPAGTAILRLNADNQIHDSSGLITIGTDGILDLNNHTEGIDRLSGSGQVTLGSGTLTVGTSSGGSTTYNGVISGPGGLTKTGSATLTLSGNNTYTGATTVTGGVLQLGVDNALADSTAVTVTSGTFDVNDRTDTVGSIAGAGALTLGSGTLTAGGNDTSTTYSGVISETGNLIKAGTGILTLSGNNTFSGSTTVSAGTLIAAHNNALGAATANATVSSGATLSINGGINVAKSTGTLSLAGAGETGQTGALVAGGTAGQTSRYTGNITLTANATIGAADNLLIVGDDYDFDNRITLGSHTLTLNTTSATGVVPTYASYPSYILDSSNLYISSTITGTGGVTKTGDGTANLIFFPSSAGVSAYTGDTLVTGGKLIIDGSDHAGIVSTNITVGNASGPGANDSVTLQMGQLSSASASYIVGDYSNITNVATSSMTIYEDGLFNMNRANNALNNLTMRGGHVTGWSGGTSYALLTVTGGITTQASSETSLIDNGELGLSANGFAFTIADGAATDDLRVDSIVHNGIGFTATDADASLVKTGTGTMVFTNVNDYQGVTQIQQGVLVIRNNDGLGAYGPSVSSLDNGTVVSSGAQLQLQQTTGGANLTVGSVSGTETLTLNGTGISSTGALYNATGDNTYHGFVRLASDSRITAASGTTLTISNTLGTEAGIMNGTGGGGQDLAVGGPGNVTIGSAIGGLVSDISKDGSGTLTLAGNNSYAGTTTVGTGGAIKVTHNQGLAGTAVTVNSGGALQFAQNALNQNLTAISGPSGATTISGTGLSNGGAIQNLNGSNTYLAGVTLGANSRITADSGSSLTLSGNITGAGYALDAGGAGNTTYNGVISGSGTTFTKTDSGTVTLGGSSANTFTGALSVNDGTLNLNKTAGTNAVGTSTTITIGDNVGAALSATLALQQSNQMPDATDITINSDGRLSMGSASDAISQIAGTGQIDLGSGALTIGADNSSSIFAGTFANSATGSFTKEGTGSLTFTQDISYNGTFNLGGGTLVLDNMDLSVTNLNITANSTIDFGATGDSHIFAGTLDFLNTSVTLNIINWTKGVDAFYATFWPGATPDLLNNGNTAPMNQIIFAGWDQSDTGWDSYDNQIYPKVPEPSTYGLMFVGACSAFFAFRRWRNAKLASTKSTR